jgi:hypothetical protein
MQTEHAVKPIAHKTLNIDEIMQLMAIKLPSKKTIQVELTANLMALKKRDPEIQLDEDFEDDILRSVDNMVFYLKDILMKYQRELLSKKECIQAIKDFRFKLDQGLKKDPVIGTLFPTSISKIIINRFENGIRKFAQANNVAKPKNNKPTRVIPQNINRNLEEIAYEFFNTISNGILLSPLALAIAGINALCSLFNGPHIKFTNNQTLKFDNSLPVNHLNGAANAKFYGICTSFMAANCHKPAKDAVIIPTKA